MPPASTQTAAADARPDIGGTFLCERCGADLTFHIGVEALPCPYCGFEKQLQPPGRRRCPARFAQQTGCSHNPARRVRWRANLSGGCQCPNRRAPRAAATELAQNRAVSAVARHARGRSTRIAGTSKKTKAVARHARGRCFLADTVSGGALQQRLARKPKRLFLEA